MKRKRILESARQHFSRFGFDQATIRDIARDAGAGVGTVLRYAESKHALLQEVWREGVRELLERPLEAQYGCSLVEGAMQLFEPFLRAYHKEPELARVVVKELPWLTGKALEDHRPDLERFLTGLTQLVNRDLERDVLAQGTNPSRLAYIFFTLYCGACIELCTLHDDASLDRTLHHLRENLELVTRGLRRSP